MFEPFELNVDWYSRHLWTAKHLGLCTDLGTLQSVFASDELRAMPRLFVNIKTFVSVQNRAPSHRTDTPPFTNSVEMNTDSVLATPELISRIFWFSNRSSVAMSMRVCQMWESVGKPSVWRDIDRKDGLVCLLQKLAMWNLEETFTVPSHQNWPEFLQYTRFVQYLHVQNDCHLLSHRNRKLASILEFVSAVRPASELFPNLRTLRIDVDNQQYLLRPSISLLHSDVKRWVIDYSMYPYRIEPFRIEFPFGQLSGLTCVELERGVEVQDFLASCISLKELPHLTSIILPSHCVTPDVLGTLSGYPALQEIRTKDEHPGHGLCLMKHPPFAPLPEGAFPKLLSLTVSGCSSQLSKLLDDEHFPLNIHTLAIETHVCEVNMWSPVFEKFVEKCQGVTEFILLDLVRNIPSSFTSLKVFLSYNLTRLEIGSYSPLAYSQEEIEELAHALPLIEILHLAPYPRLVSAAFGTLTFNHLPLFARCCPKLVHFAILLDITQLWDNLTEDMVPFAALQELDLGMSFAFSFHAESSAVFRFFLSKLLPENCQFTFYHNENVRAPISAIKRLTATKGVTEWQEISQRSRQRKVSL